MIKAVLDTSVLVKSVFKPLRSLSIEAYDRELKTHEKCAALVKLIEDRDIEVYVPKVCVVETAAVVKRLASRAMAAKVSRGVMRSYNMVDESAIFDAAWEVALSTGCSGFDSYFIALARIKDAALFTDDSGMHLHAEEACVNSILIRNTDLEEFESYF